MASLADVAAEGFKPLTRGATFDTRKGERDASFRPLTRAATFTGDSLYAHPVSARYRGASFDHKKPSMNQIAVITDTFSTGQLIASMLHAQGYHVVRVLSADLKELLEMAPDGATCEFIKTLAVDTAADYEDEIARILAELSQLQYPISAVIAGAETGVELADVLSERLGMPLSNGTALTEARRNKFVMGETIRSAGVRAVKQLASASWEEIEIFIAEWNPSPFKVIVKPLDSAGSDDVTLCLSLAQVQAAVTHIIGKTNGLGLVNGAVLVQEFLEGTEYVIDTVSLNGYHKVTAIWEYDRRAVNGAAFVCFGQRLLTIDAPCCQQLVEYQLKVLDALGIKNGPTHGEVKWCRGEPVLVEVGARCHGGDGFWTTICDEVYGYNQAQLTIDVNLNPEAWRKVPDVPIARRCFGALKWLISRHDGVLQSYSPANVDEIKSSGSYRGHQVFRDPGEQIKPTVNCFTWAGCVKLANADSDSLEADYARLEELEQSTLIQLEEA